MEMEREGLTREGRRKRDRPDPQAETTTVDDEDLRIRESIDRLWDDVRKYLAEAAAAPAESLVDGDDDDPGFDLRRFRKRWNDSWSGAGRHGDFEDTTLIPPMRYTDKPPRATLSLCLCDTIEVFSVKVSQIGEGLQWPLDVFGIVAIRDTIDENRSIIFQRSSLNCQTLTEKICMSRGKTGCKPEFNWALSNSSHFSMTSKCTLPYLF